MYFLKFISRFFFRPLHLQKVRTLFAVQFANLPWAVLSGLVPGEMLLCWWWCWLLHFCFLLWVWHRNVLQKPGGKSFGSSDKTLRTPSPNSFPLSCSSFESNKRLTNYYKLRLLCASKPSLLNPNKYACLWSSSDLPSAVSDVKLINSSILHSDRPNDPF